MRSRAGNHWRRFSTWKKTWAIALLSMTLAAGTVVQRSPAPHAERPPSSRPTVSDRHAAATAVPGPRHDATTSRDLTEDPQSDLMGDIESLLARLERSDLEERMLAVELMRGREEPAVLQALSRTLADPDPDVRRAAFRAVVDMSLTGGKAPELTALLQQALSDPDDRVRIDALDALAERGEAGLTAIRDAVADPSEEVGQYARHLVERFQVE